MRHPGPFRCSATLRSGKTLVMFAILLPVLLGMTGLVIDGGLLMAAHRQLQNAADAAALAAAMDKHRGATDATALASANSFMAGNGMNGVSLVLNAGSSNALNIPPQDPGNTGSPYKDNANFAEAIVTRQVNTFFMPVLGVNSSQITARAVAGFEPVGAGEGAIVLDPTEAPGLAVTSNNSRLIVKGSVVVNSRGRGLDQYGGNVDGPYAQPAVSTGGPNIEPKPIVAADVQVVGGVDTPGNIRAYDAAFAAGGYYYDTTNFDLPFSTGNPIAPDPLLKLLTPTTSNGVRAFYPNKLGVNQGSPQDISVGNGETVTLVPGIYKTISITGGTVTFNPNPGGIFVVGMNRTGNGNSFNINGGTVTGNGIMIYNTGSNYTPSGTPDSTDNTSGSDDFQGGISRPPPNPPGSMGGVTINGGNVTFSPITDVNSPFVGMMFYQRRWNKSSANIAGNSSTLDIRGTLYAKWAKFQLAGTGKFNAQFVVGSMTISGGATVTIDANGKEFGLTNQVFLVE